MSENAAQNVAGKIIMISGKERCDIAYALGTLVHVTHKSVLFMDNSLTHDLYAVFAGTNETNEVLEYGDVVVVKDRKVPYKDQIQFDVVIIYNGLNVADCLCLKADEYIIAPGEEAIEVERMKSFVEKLKVQSFTDRFTLIQRDKVGRKQTLGTIASKIGIRPTRSYVLEYSETDYGAYVALTINGNRGISGISEEMKDLTAELMTVMLGESEKRIKKLLKLM